MPETETPRPASLVHLEPIDTILARARAVVAAEAAMRDYIRAHFPFPTILEDSDLVRLDRALTQAKADLVAACAAHTLVVFEAQGLVVALTRLAQAHAEASRRYSGEALRAPQDQPG